jgi:glycosyltransferase involved in cell wall biosynthesis
MDKARTLGVDGSVRYLGSKKLEELVHEIADCDVGVIPNQRNTFTEINTPTRIFEYLALGKPVIAPSTLGILDYFDAGSLLFFEPGNQKSLALQMAYAATHSVEALGIAEAGQQVYLAHAWEQERETLVRLVAGLLEAGKAA